jgi:hypothetical protein
MKYVIVSLYFLASSALLYAEEAKLMPEVVKLFQDAPKLAQNLRRFETLSMEYTEEGFVDGKWELFGAQTIVADFRKDILKVKSVREEKDSAGRRYRTYGEIVESFQTGKRISIHADLDEGENNIFFPRKLKQPYAKISPLLASPYGICNSGIAYFSNNFFLYFDSKLPMRYRTLLETIQDPAEQKAKRVKIKQLTPNTAIVDIGSEYFIDLSKGMPYKYVSRYIDTENGPPKEKSIEVTEFTLKDGRLFPTAILYTENGNPLSRQKVNPKTLKIDHLISPSDFAVKIYPGTLVRDEIENKEYIAGREMTSADYKELERQLKDLADEVRKSDEKAKKGQEANREQQEKEKH